MRSLALLAVAACVAACCMAMVQARPDARRLDSGLAVGDETLQRRPTATTGHGLDVDWTKSVYQGELRNVKADVPTQIRLAFIPVRRAHTRERPESGEW